RILSSSNGGAKPHAALRHGVTRRGLCALRSWSAGVTVIVRRAAIPFAAAIVARPRCAVTWIENVLGRRKPRPVQPRQRRGDILGRALGEQRPRQHQILGGGLLGEQGILQHSFLIELANLISGG